MNKKGFTLAELLGVIILLSIIAIIAISTTGTNLEEGRQKACLAQGKNIIEAMKAYMVDNPNELPADENIEFSKKVEFLITHGYLAEDFTNPSTEKKYADDTYAVVMLRGSNYIYRVRYTPDDKCDLESGKKDEIEDNVKINQPGITSTKDSITVTANASANDGIESYEFSINGGTTWQNNGSNNIYTFTGLEDDK
ncbi:MAG: prepilin-type N-terminal cleavage/methylation domain-containing protein, partial [Bacillus sp. (in: Bacteria)]|nr:prepilin-type N-terminal cleavage/methylation domain-containing protein [Bacillus sp. (in: firmicutes)]